MKSVLVVLDIDGVLNALSKKPPRFAWRDWQHLSVFNATDNLAYPFLVAEDVAQYFRDLALIPEIEIRTLSTWLENSEAVYDALELPRFPLIPYEDMDFYEDRKMRGWWKFSALSRFAEDSNQSILWIDDDLKFHSASSSWVPYVGLGVSPNTNHGLIPKNLKRINSFLSDRNITPPQIGI